MTEQTRQAKLFIPSLIIFGLLSVTGCNSKTEPAASAPNQAAEIPASTSAPQAAAAPEKPATEEKTSEAKAKPSSKPERKAVTEKTATKPSSTQKATEASATEKKAPVCADCGTITSINMVEQAGEGSGLGAIAGGVAGAVLGHQVGGGTGKDIATIAGAAGGAYAGHQIEKKMKKTMRYDITVKMENGQHRTISQNEAPAFAVGDKVKIVDGMLQRN